MARDKVNHNARINLERACRRGQCEQWAFMERTETATWWVPFQVTYRQIFPIDRGEQAVATYVYLFILFMQGTVPTSIQHNQHAAMVYKVLLFHSAGCCNRVPGCSTCSTLWETLTSTLLIGWKVPYYH
jgi:hypothetical protein